MMANNYDSLDGRFFFVHWENDPDFICCSWRTDPQAMKEAWFDFLYYSPHRLVILKVVKASLQDELFITKCLNAISPIASLPSPSWRPSNASLSRFMKDAPCATREARKMIGHANGRLLWRISNSEDAPKTAKEIIIEQLGASEAFLAPATIHALPNIGLPQQTIYNTLSRLRKEGLVYQPEAGFYALSLSGQAFYDKLVAARPERKSVRSLCP
jgi:DNA-binding transcriptional ArsR family regulator